MDESSKTPKYIMTVSLSVFEHLGVGLYSNVPAVLSEIVANAWDADAENVRIDIDSKHGRIEIYDDGHGMSEQDINDKYLKIGYKKREQPDFGKTLRFGRPPMGRKGIGKLSVFAIAECVEIHTVKDQQVNALLLNSSDITEAIKSDNSETYNPEALSSEMVEIEKGTKVILTKLKRRIHTTPDNLSRRLARRFTVIGTDTFNVYIDDKPISAKDRDYCKFVEYLWNFEGNKVEMSEMFANAKCKTEEGNEFGKGVRRSISGWIGTVHSQKQISEETNGIAIFANGKLVHENLLKDMKQGGIWTKYVIGEINANFMDDSESEDIITSARQSLNQESERYEELKNFLEKE